MEDVTDIGFRMLCKRFGAAMVYTEFVSAEALIRDVKSTQQKLIISDEERPVGIQIYGRDIEAMVEAAKIVEQRTRKLRHWRSRPGGGRSGSSGRAVPSPRS